MISVKDVAMAAVVAAALLCTLVCCFATSALAAPTYATAIVEWVPGEYDLGYPDPHCPGNPLGPPSFDLSDAWGIGRGGSLTLEMGSPFTDSPGLDLTVYEFGLSVGGANDPYDVWVSGDVQNWYFVGYSPGDRTSFDLFGIGGPGPFNYVKIIDRDTSGQFDGADIDAVEVPEPATLSLLALGGAVLAARRRKG